MRLLFSCGCRWLTYGLVLTALALPSWGEERGWVPLTGANGLDAWREPTNGWLLAESVALDGQNPKLLAAKPGTGILVTGKGRARNLVSKQNFGDLEAHVEFLIPKGSNSGVKFEGLYEIQILDSYGSQKKLTGDSCGGIYPRAEEKPKYHHIDDGTPPRTNAARPPGEWQTLDVIFQTPRFDATGKKIANARFVKVVLNGTVIHEHVEVAYPTGAAWTKPEIPTGPLLLQGDHGPVAFREARVRPYSGELKKN